MFYDVFVPPTMEMGSYKTRVKDTYRSKAQEALQDYNSAREHDGLMPLKRMPNGTEYRPLYVYEVEQYTGAPYGWEVVCIETNRSEAKKRLVEYRENQPEYPARIYRRPLSTPEAIGEMGDI